MIQSSEVSLLFVMTRFVLYSVVAVVDRSRVTTRFQQTQIDRIPRGKRRQEMSDH